MMEEMWSNISMTGSSHNIQIQQQYLTYYIMGIGGMAVCCLGIIGNILSIVVLTQKCMNSSTYSYLTSLAVCDLLFLLFSMIILVKDTEKPPHDYFSQTNVLIYFSKYLFSYLHPIAFTFQVTSIWLTLAFTVDRYIMICHPFKAERFCSVSRARKVIAGIYLLGILYNIPKFFEYRPLTVTLGDSNSVNSDVTEFGKSMVFRLIFHSWLYLILICVVPFIALAVLNAFLMYAVSKSRQRGREINAADRRRNDTTVMLIGVVVIFFLCQSPALISRLMWTFKSADVFNSIPLSVLNEVGNLLIILNSSINIVPYYFFGKKFRREFLRVFCCCIVNSETIRRISRDVSIMSILPHRTSSTVVQQSINIRELQTANTTNSRLKLGKYFKKCSKKRKDSEENSSVEHSLDQYEPLQNGLREINRNYQGIKSTNGHALSSRMNQNSESVALNNGNCNNVCQNDNDANTCLETQRNDRANVMKTKKRVTRQSLAELLPKTKNKSNKNKNSESQF